MGRESGRQLTELLPLERRLIRPVSAAGAIVNTWPPVAIGFLTFDAGRIKDAHHYIDSTSFRRHICMLEVPASVYR